MKYTIWSNENLWEDFDEWKAEFIACNPDLDGLDDEDLSDIQWEECNDSINEVRSELDISVGTVIAIEDLGRWDGHHHTHKLFRRATISDLLCSECDYCTFYLDENFDLCLDETHHDGSNHITFRAFKEDVDEDELLDALFEGKANEEMIERYTVSVGEQIAKVYGIKH